MADNPAYDSTMGTPPPYTEVYQDPPPPYTPAGWNQSAPTVPEGPQRVVMVNKSIFHKGARFDKNSPPSIPPPAPGYQPNELQRMAMQGPVQVVLQNNQR